MSKPKEILKIEKTFNITLNEIALVDSGNALYDLGNYQEAIKYYDKAIELNSDFPRAYLNKGQALKRLGYFQEAMECYDKTIELMPDCAKAYSLKGNATSGLYETHIYNYDEL